MNSLERRQRRRSVDFIVNFQHFSHLFLVFLLVTSNKLMFAGTLIVHFSFVWYDMNLIN